MGALFDYQCCNKYLMPPSPRGSLPTSGAASPPPEAVHGLQADVLSLRDAIAETPPPPGVTATSAAVAALLGLPLAQDGHGRTVVD